MAGSMWELGFDWFDYNFYGNNGNCTNCANVTSGGLRVDRGGGWNYSGESYLRAALRDYAAPDFRYLSLGFRCARPAE